MLPQEDDLQVDMAFSVSSRHPVWIMTVMRSKPMIGWLWNQCRTRCASVWGGAWVIKYLILKSAVYLAFFLSPRIKIIKDQTYSTNQDDTQRSELFTHELKLDLS